MIPGKAPLTIYRGDTQPWQFRLWTDAGSTVPADLTGAAVAVQIRAADNVLTNVACTVTTPNIVDAILSAAVARTLAVGKGIWDLEITWPDGTVSTPVGGSVKVLEDVTNSELV